jgi:alginate O-acetyltransferase complex protein AlgJ
MTDTHWNDSGAFVGYSVIIKAVQQVLPQWHIVAQTESDFIRSPVSSEVGDLAKMMDMPDQYPAKGFGMIRKIPFQIPSELMNRNEVTVMDLNNPKAPNLVLYRDSFGISLAPMLGPNFNQTVYAFHYELDPNLIAKYKPDLVISEFLERNLYLAPPTDPPEIQHFDVH